jgi:hypothetical protein
MSGMQMLMPIALAIVFLLFIVGTSHYQTIHAYPNGWGAYIVSKENLGTLPGLTAGGALEMVSAWRYCHPLIAQ